MFPGSEKYMGFAFFFNGFLMIISTVKKEDIVYDNFFMTLTLFTGFMQYVYNPKDEQITIFSFSCSVFAGWIGYNLIQQHRNLKELCEVRGKNLRDYLKDQVDLKNKLIETSIKNSILEDAQVQRNEQYKTLLKEYKKQNENMKTIFLRNMLKHQRVDENCLTGKSELSELIEMFDDSKEKISDGVYLTLMNKSRKIYENFEKIRLANM